MKTHTLFAAAGALAATAWLINAVLPPAANAAAAPAAPAASPTSYTISQTDRFVLTFQAGRLVKLDSLTGDFSLLNQFDGTWNPVVIPTRDAMNEDENSRNINFLWQNMNNANLSRLADPARRRGRFHFINVYFNPDGLTLPPPEVPANIDGTGTSNPNYFNRLVRFDSVTGEFALMDTESATFVRVVIPVKQMPPDVNSDNVRLISGLRL